MAAMNCCAISYLHYIVISIACSARLEVFHCPERNNIRKIEGLHLLTPLLREELPQTPSPPS